jgi:hypothetical protein
MGAWGLRHTPASRELSVRAKLLEDGGPKLWAEFMAELRHLHLGAPAPKVSVFAKLQAAYEAAMASGPARRSRGARERATKTGAKPVRRATRKIGKDIVW